MKITKEALQKLITECVDQKIDEMVDSGPPLEEMANDQPLDMRTVGVRWDNMKYLSAKGKLAGKWSVIMKAYEECGEDEDRTLAVLKAAAATLEANKTRKPSKPPEEMASQAELTDFSKF